MLMDAATVNRLVTSPTALALKQAGLEYLLFDARLAAELRAYARADRADRAAHSEVQRPASRQAGPHGSQAAAGQTAQTRSRPQADGQAGFGAAAVGTGQARPSSGTGQVAQVRSRTWTDEPERFPAARDEQFWSESTGHGADQSDDQPVWSPLWRERLQKTKKAPVLWTYWNLGHDLCGNPCPKRRALLRELLDELGHAPGTHSFWPLAMPGGQGTELVARPELFWSGVRLLESRAVVVMGLPALQALELARTGDNGDSGDGPGKLCPFQLKRYQGRLLVVLPAPELLVESLEHKQLYAFLRQALAPFAP